MFPDKVIFIFKLHITTVFNMKSIIDNNYFDQQSLSKINK